MSDLRHWLKENAALRFNYRDGSWQFHAGWFWIIGIALIVAHCAGQP